MRLESASSFLLRAAKDAEELAPMLRRYPDVRYEPLDFHYVCIQGLGALNHAVVEDLTNYYG